VASNLGRFKGHGLNHLQKSLYLIFAKKRAESGFKTMKWEKNAGINQQEALIFCCESKRLKQLRSKVPGFSRDFFFPNEFLAFSLQSLKAYQPIEVMKKIRNFSRNLKLDAPSLQRIGPKKIRIPKKLK